MVNKNDTNYKIRNKEWLVEAVELGEGYNGDYNPDNPNDKSLMRFDVYQIMSDSDTPEDETLYSYCTLIPYENEKAVAKFLQRVLYTLDNYGYNRQELELLTWISPEELEKD